MYLMIGCCCCCCCFVERFDDPPSNLYYVLKILTLSSTALTIPTKFRNSPASIDQMRKAPSPFHPLPQYPSVLVVMVYCGNTCWQTAAVMALSSIPNECEYP